MLFPSPPGCSADGRQHSEPQAVASGGISGRPEAHWGAEGGCVGAEWAGEGQDLLTTAPAVRPDRGYSCGGVRVSYFYPAR